MRIAVALALVGCTGAAPRYRVEGAPADAAPLEAMVADGARRVTSFFGAPFAQPFVVRVYASRAALDARMREAWKQPDLKSQCWMVGVGTAAELMLLAPSRWRAEACEHDPDDRAAIARLVTHELVHVYHGQLNPRLENDPDAMEPLGWLVEGLAVHVSGQLDDGHLASAADAIRAGAAPAALAAAWSGKYRYGVSGSLVAFVDRTWGRAVLVALLRAQSSDEVLARLGVREAELLSRWRASVVGP